MDEMRIRSKFARGLCSKLLRTIIKKKTGCEIDISLNNLVVKVINGRTKAHLDLEAELEKKDLIKLLNLD